MSRPVRTSPCIACPYRRDVPSGVWSQEEYDKLRDFDNVTSEQPAVVFACHATPEKLCNGWAIVHSNRGHDRELLALRLWPSKVPVPSAVELFDSGGAAADYGERDIDNPSDEARERVQQLLRKHSHLDVPESKGE